MAQAGINLIPELTEKELRNTVNRKRANKAAIVTLVVIGAIVGFLIIYRVYLGLRAGDIASRTQKAEEQISKLQDVEVSQLTLADKLTQARKILASALPGSVALDQVTKAALEANSIEIKQLNLDATGLIQVDGIAANSDIFATWITNLTTGESAKNINRINLTSLVKVDNGYSFSLNMSFNQRGILGQ